MKPYLSIITPCYNAEKFIEDAICSVLGQKSDWIEHILVDDGSVDHTPEICRRYESESVKYVRTDNLGAGHARNVGMSFARGTWIAFLDGDDLFLENSISDQLKIKLEKYESDGIDLVFTARSRTDMDRTSVELTEAARPEQIEHHIPELEFWTYLYRKDALVAGNVRFYEYRRQDIESAFRYKACIAAGKCITDNQIRFYLQRENPESNTHTWNCFTLYEVKAHVYYDLFVNTPVSEDRNYLKAVVIQSIVNYYKDSIRYGVKSQEKFMEMHELLQNVVKNTENTDRTMQYRKLILLDYFYKIILMTRYRKN